jgi:tetratricopeptide (TPR) repeat protein
MRNYAQARFYYRKASHLNPEDSKLYYKVACTYMNEGQWGQAVRHLETAMNIHPSQPEYNLAMGECKMELNDIRQAIHFFTNVVRMRPRNISSWEALIRCLYSAEYFEEALEQVLAAQKITEGKVIFVYYLSAIYFAMKKSKEALLHLEKALSKAPKLLKKFIELNPAILQNQQVVDLIAKYKRNKSF